jgi:orotidine-5'-phosphate decarboxylase
LPIVARERSLIPACDVPSLDELERLVKGTASVSGVGAYKVGLELTIKYGLREVVNLIRRSTSLPVIYDHQKGATDIPELGERFAVSCREAGADAVVLMPLAGPETEKRWITACLEVGLGVVVGGHMTHRAFLRSDGGFVADEAPVAIYRRAADLGVRDFVVPANNAAAVEAYRRILEELGVQCVFYALEFVAQGEKIGEFRRAAGERWHVIVGSAVYRAEDPRSAAEEIAEQIR